MRFSDLGLHEKYHIESEIMTSDMECWKCGEVWVAIHPVHEWLQCPNRHWVQVPPLEDER